MKKCTQCERQLSLSEFNNSKKSKDGLNWECRKCSGGRREVHVQVRYEIMKDYLSQGCMDCGDKRLPVLELDHRDSESKLNSVSSLIRKCARIEVIKAEMSKCDVVCCNCHRIRTYKRCGSWRILGEYKITR